MVRLYLGSGQQLKGNIFHQTLPKDYLLLFQKQCYCFSLTAVINQSTQCHYCILLLNYVCTFNNIKTLDVNIMDFSHQATNDGRDELNKHIFYCC